MGLSGFEFATAMIYTAYTFLCDSRSRRVRHRYDIRCVITHMRVIPFGHRVRFAAMIFAAGLVAATIYPLHGEYLLCDISF